MSFNSHGICQFGPLFEKHIIITRSKGCLDVASMLRKLGKLIFIRNGPTFACELTVVLATALVPADHADDVLTVVCLALAVRMTSNT